jgi:hypothetical protein
MKTIATAMVIAGSFIISASGQGFLNLDFESAYNLTNPPVNGEPVSIANALPGWAAYDGNLALSHVYYVSNYFPGGVSTSVELEGGALALGGDFSVGLYLESSISQTGLVPADAESLEFEAQGPGPGYSLGAAGLTVSLGGQNLSYSALSDGPDHIVYGANIPAGIDGQMEELMFSCQGAGSGNALLDNIEFSTMSVPEPGEWTMIGLGVVLFGVWTRKQQRWKDI